MKLIIAEKPMVARAIADAIEGTAITKDGYITKGEYAITWAMGHLLELKDPEDYDEKLKMWSLDTLPIYFADWQMKPSCQGNDNAKLAQLNKIKTLLKQSNCVIHAGDPDDEGQYLIDEILHYFQYQGAVYRMNTGDTTTAALKDALNHLTDNAPLEKIGWSAHARRISDKIVGYNCSRYFSLKNPEVLLTIGRVQTATLGMVVARDDLIAGHIKQVYYDITATLLCNGQKVTVKYQPAKNDKNLDDGKILSESYAQTKVAMLQNETLKDVSVAYEEELEPPPLPFNLTELQGFCSKTFGYEPSKVMEITQRLRDSYKAITYNRSDCQFLSEKQYKEAPTVMKTVLSNLSGLLPHSAQPDMSLHSRCFNDANITAHTAIIPQNTSLSLDSLSQEEVNVYKSICLFYIAQFLPSRKKGKTTLKASTPDGGTVNAVSTKTIADGYKKILSQRAAAEESEGETESTLSSIPQGQYNADVLDATYTAKETTPPTRYTKATLAKDMTRIAKYVQNPEVKRLLLSKDKDKKGENGSIGTVATRAAIIDRLEEHGYIETKNKKLCATPLGKELYRVLPDELKKPDMTAYWWSIQEDIQNGSVPWTALTDSVLEMVARVVQTDYPTLNMSLIPDTLKRKSTQKRSIGICPRCGRTIYESSKSFYCSGYNDGCKFVIWKNPKLPMFKNETITSKQVITWLSGWDSTATKKTSKKAVTMSKLYSQKKDKEFSARVFLSDDAKSQYGPEFVLSFDTPSKGGKQS